MFLNVEAWKWDLIFCQFWVFFVFKLLFSFFWLCKEAQCVYLHLHLGQKLEMEFERARVFRKFQEDGKMMKDGEDVSDIR